jgi:hypothetical protein
MAWESGGRKVHWRLAGRMAHWRWAGRAWEAVGRVGA